MKEQATTSTQNFKDIAATPQSLWQAFTDPKALETFLAPGDMTAKVHNFNLSVGGGYEMSLFYPFSEVTSPGKTSAKEDRFISKFIELTPYKRIVQAINFHSADPAFAGEMIMEITFELKDKSTRVTIVFTNIPYGIRPHDNEAGTEQSLVKLEKYVMDLN